MIGVFLGWFLELVVPLRQILLWLPQSLVSPVRQIIFLHFICSYRPATWQAAVLGRPVSVSLGRSQFRLQQLYSTVYSQSNKKHQESIPFPSLPPPPHSPTASPPLSLSVGMQIWRTIILSGMQIFLQARGKSQSERSTRELFTVKIYIFSCHAQIIWCFFLLRQHDHEAHLERQKTSKGFRFSFRPSQNYPVFFKIFLNSHLVTRDGRGSAQRPICMLMSLKRRVRAANGRVALPT